MVQDTVSFPSYGSLSSDVEGSPPSAQSRLAHWIYEESVEEPEKTTRGNACYGGDTLNFRDSDDEENDGSDSSGLGSDGIPKRVETENDGREIPLTSWAFPNFAVQVVAAILLGLGYSTYSMQSSLSSLEQKYSSQQIAVVPYVATILARVREPSNPTFAHVLPSSELQFA